MINMNLEFIKIISIYALAIIQYAIIVGSVFFLLYLIIHFCLYPIFKMPLYISKWKIRKHKNNLKILNLVEKNCDDCNNFQSVKKCKKCKKYLNIKTNKGNKNEL
jgi:hypothetical protein